VEYFEHLLKTISRAEHAGAARFNGQPLASDFQFILQSRIECNSTRTVRYRLESDHHVLRLPIPLKQAVNLTEVESQAQKRARVAEEKSDSKEDDENVIPVVPLEACFEEWGASELITDFKSPALGGAVSAEGASKQSRFASFPPFLVIQAQRFTIDASWQQSKLEVKLQVPDTINLERYRGSVGDDGNSVFNLFKEGEVPMPEESEQPSPQAASSGQTAEPSIDESVLAALADMGFSQNGCKRACIACGNDLPQAMEWIFNHSSDDDFNDPPASTSTATTAKSGANPESVMMLSSMGFSEAHATAALEQCGGDMERSADWLFSHADDLDGAIAALATGAPSTTTPPTDAASVRNGPGVYRLRGFGNVHPCVIYMQALHLC
jgi:ubiquitin carboxyl-terminal hydrolase 5/13